MMLAPSIRLHGGPVIRTRLLAPLVIGLAAIAASGFAATATAPTATPSFLGDAPFWSGSPDAGAFRALNQKRLAYARAEIAKLVAVQGPHTVANTLTPYDEASRALDAADNQSGLIEEVHPDSTVRQASEAVSQEVATARSEIALDRRVYDALAAIRLEGVDAETKFYITRELRDFRLAGVDQDAATRARIKQLREELVKYGQDFDRNIRTGVRTIQVKPGDLTGLPQDFIAAHKPGADGMITLDTNYPDYIPTESYCSNDDVRRRLYIEFNNRAYPANEAVLRRMIEARDSLAKRVGFPDWADCITANQMSGNAKNVRDFIDKIVAASGPSAERDFKVLLAAKQKDDPKATNLNFWDVSYYTEQVKRSSYSFDSQSIRPYLPFTEVRQGVLDVASQLFGLTFKPVQGVAVWDPSVECFEVYDGAKKIGRFYLDMHPRDNKYKHAAEFTIRTGIEGKQLPEAALVCNLPGGVAGDPGLCEIADVNTMFHEFGHLMHEIIGGHRRWCGTSGIKTEHDFVEAPSQMLEEWMQDPSVLQTFAKQYQSGEAVPADLVHRMKRANEFGKGLAVRRQMVYADLSLSIYDHDPAKVDVDGIAKDLVGRYQPYPYLDETHFPCAFGHLDGYSAVYYTYMWSLVIAKDMFSAFDHDHLLDAKVATRYKNAVLAKGGSRPAGDLVADFLGRPFSFESYKKWLDEAP
jgi:thimet oligopeptidase